MRGSILSHDDEAPEAPLDGLLRAVHRTRNTIEEETAALESGATADYGEFRHRKDLCLLELSRRAPALVNPPRDPEMIAALRDLKDAIIRNQKTLRCHVNAARQVSAIIMKSMAEEDSDHTYSTRAARKRPPA